MGRSEEWKTDGFKYPKRGTAHISPFFEDFDMCNSATIHASQTHRLQFSKMVERKEKGGFSWEGLQLILKSKRRTAHIDIVFFRFNLRDSATRHVSQTLFQFSKIVRRKEKGGFSLGDSRPFLKLTLCSSSRSCVYLELLFNTTAENCDAFTKKNIGVEFMYFTPFCETCFAGQVLFKKWRKPLKGRDGVLAHGGLDYFFQRYTSCARFRTHVSGCTSLWWKSIAVYDSVGEEGEIEQGGVYTPCSSHSISSPNEIIALFLK